MQVRRCKKLIEYAIDHFIFAFRYQNATNYDPMYANFIYFI